MKEHEIISEIRSVLIKNWDPVGIGDNSNLSDEYDDYIGPIIKVLTQKLPIESIVSLLKKIESTEMGIERVDTKCLHDAATKLKSIGDKYY